MRDFSFTGLEVHSQNAWDFRWMLKTLDFAQRHEMSAVVLHRNDIVDRMIHPAEYFGAPRAAYKSPFESYAHIFRTLQQYTPTRRSRPLQRRDYLKRVIHEADLRGIQVYVQNKELWFPEILVELHPEVLRNGVICPTEPFWQEFVDVKYTQLFQDLPNLAGVITSPATAESRVSISSNRCNCERCESTTSSEWYRTLLMAMYQPINQAGKQLVVRDFSFNPKSLHELGTTVESLPADVIVSLKSSPHDFYPTFPNNERMGNVGDHRQWMEYDTMGQFLGWGTVPSSMIRDMRQRLRYAKDSGVEGVVFRTDWEGLEGHSAFSTLNLVNIYAGAALSKSLEASEDEIYQDWLEGEGHLRPNLSSAKKAATVANVSKILGETSAVIEAALYMNGCVICESSMFPISLDHVWWLAEEKNSLKNWSPSKADALNTTEDNMHAIFAEKDYAVSVAQRLLTEIRSESDGLSEVANAQLDTGFSLMYDYVRCLRAVGRACILAKFCLSQEKPTTRVASAMEQLKESLRELRSLAGELQELYTSTSYSHTAYLLLSPERLVALYDDISSSVSEVTQA